MHFEYYMPTRLIFGRGRLKELSHYPFPGSKALILITQGQSMRNLGYLGVVLKILEEAGIDSAVYDRVALNPSDAQVMEAAEFARNEKCDMLIGLGGGSAIDTAKAAAIMVNNPGTYWDYAKLRKEIVEKVLPVIAIPTTAGTGTETNQWCMISNRETKEKIAFGCPQSFPVLAVVDPELMLSVPPHLTAYQGMEAFFHAAEGYLANVAKPISDLYALDTLRRISHFLPIAVADGTNLQAREEMAVAAAQAGIIAALSECAAEYSIDHALSAYYPQLPHGAGMVAMSIPYFSYLLEKERKKVEIRYADMAHVMGWPGEQPEEFIDALKLLIREIGMSDLHLSNWGISQQEVDLLSANSFAAMSFLYNTDSEQRLQNNAACIIRGTVN